MVREAQSVIHHDFPMPGGFTIRYVEEDPLFPSISLRIEMYTRKKVKSGHFPHDLIMLELPAENELRKLLNRRYKRRKKNRSV